MKRAPPKGVEYARGSRSKPYPRQQVWAAAARRVHRFHVTRTEQWGLAFQPPSAHSRAIGSPSSQSWRHESPTPPTLERSRHIDHSADSGDDGVANEDRDLTNHDNGRKNAIVTRGVERASSINARWSLHCPAGNHRNPTHHDQGTAASGNDAGGWRCSSLTATRFRIDSTKRLPADAVRTGAHQTIAEFARAFIYSERADNDGENGEYIRYSKSQITPHRQDE